MSLYNLSCKIINRRSGRNAVAAAAYRSGTKMYDDELGITYNYSSKGEVVMSEVMLPQSAPEAFHDRQVLWNSVQRNEKRIDAQLCREFEIAFPKELSRAQQIFCAREFIKENFISKGMIADWAFHNKADNPHFHVMVTLRPVNKNGIWLAKGKSVFANDRDKKGKAIYNPDKPVYSPKDKEHTKQYRIPKLDKDGNQKFREREGKGREYLWEKVNIQFTGWDSHDNMEAWRKSWADTCNQFLDEKYKIDHRSYERQGIPLIPTIHLGPAAWAMEQRGIRTERGNYNRSVREYNANLLKYYENQESNADEVKRLENELKMIETARQQIERTAIKVQRMLNRKNKNIKKYYELKGKLWDSYYDEQNERMVYGALHKQNRPTGFLAGRKKKVFDQARRVAVKHFYRREKLISIYDKKYEKTNQKWLDAKQTFSWLNRDMAINKQKTKNVEHIAQLTLSNREDDKGMKDNQVLRTTLDKEDEENKRFWRGL